VRLQPVGAGALHLAVDVEHRRAFHEDGVAALDLDVGRRVAAVENGRNIDLALFGLAAAALQYRHRVGPGGADAARQRQNVGEARAGVLQHIGTRPEELSEHVHLPAAHLDDRHRHLRVDDVSSALQLIGDPASRLGRRETVQGDFADERKHDAAPGREARLGRQVLVLEHRDANAVARAERFFRLARIDRLRLGGGRRRHRDGGEQEPGESAQCAGRRA
jgi:hypothetical protein